MQIGEMDEAVCRLTVSNSAPPDFQPGRFEPLGIREHAERRGRKGRAEAGQEPAAAHRAEIPGGFR